MLTHFYDIESLSNVFTLCNFHPEVPSVDVFYLVDDPALVSAPNFRQYVTDRILDANRNFHGRVDFFDLSTEAANCELARQFGLSNARLVNDPDSPSDYPMEFRPVCDTDPGYDEDVHPFLMGYNSYNYDTTMLAMYFYEAFAITDQGVRFTPVAASLMRECNDILFLPRFKKSMPTALTQTFNQKGKFWSDSSYADDRWKIRKCMLMSGRHIDVARLNEKQQHVGLKRLVGMMGGQILESSKLRPGQSVIEDMDQLADLIAYNVSDCVNLKEYVFENKAYRGQFFLKRGLLTTYPELIYEKRADAYAPDIDPKRVRRDRMTLDSSSAQLATKSLCPYGHLTDIPVVSFMYPSERKAKELGIPRVNVLEELRKFFYKNFPQPGLRAEFDRIYRYYKAIEGKNFNTSDNYAEDYAGKPWNPPEDIRRLSKADTCLFYYDKTGDPTSCFTVFSIGGLHGAEYNKALYEDDCAKFDAEKALFDQVQAIHPDPCGLRAAKTVDVTGPDGSIRTYKYNRFLTSGSTKRNAAYKDIEKKRPVLFKADEDGVTKLNERYTFTSADSTNHEDFTSYYPNLLRMLSAFHNDGLGYDRYAEIFENKQRYGFLQKSKNADLTPEDAAKYRDLRELTGLPLDPLHISDEERATYDIQRDGTKLILNSASGAADANFESNIRMNNMIISMRCIGQMFSYRIGQAQALEGARIISTNTDGLFTVLEATLNNAILEREAKDINVDIEPEPTFLISKDSNNRIEMDEVTGEVQRASGGKLACRKGPDPTKSLDHPAIIDHALTEYLIVASQGYKGLGIDRDFDDAIGMSILRAADRVFPDKAKRLRMFQNIIASSTGSVSYNYAFRHGSPGVPIILQHYNRVFIMRDDTPDTVGIQVAVSRKITPATKKKRANNGERPQQHDPLALQVLNANGVAFGDIGPESEAGIKKLTNVETDWHMLICNEDLSLMDPAKQDFILSHLDYDKYLTLLRMAYENNWRNHVPGPEGNGLDDDGVVVPPTDVPAAVPVAVAQSADDAQGAVSTPSVPDDDDDPPFDVDPPVDETPVKAPQEPVKAPVAPKASQDVQSTPAAPEPVQAPSVAVPAPQSSYAAQVAAPLPETPAPAKPVHKHPWANPAPTYRLTPEQMAQLAGGDWPPSDDPFPGDGPDVANPDMERLNASLQECLAIAEGIHDATSEQLRRSEELIARIRGLLGEGGDGRG